ncbi:MAG: hypothetical protein J2P40_10505 [Candidatus Dormibacteraeota bacterium]|nr:hypothetical protein [Candidatus Dormibacteraeota bacterium]MBO0761692.1 hypothetical protein [Candidatus Dormibacteraeota bacterium]
MTDSCSAVPADLEAYGTAGLQMDALLRAQAERLQDAINKLMASHPDPAVLGRVPPVGHDLSHYAAANANTDVWVGDVGQAFERANRHGSRTQVQTASKQAVDSYLRREEPHGPQGEQILARLDPRAHGSVVGSWHSVSDWLMEHKDWLQTNWGFFAMGGQLPLVLATFKNFRWTAHGNVLESLMHSFRGFRLTMDGGWTMVHNARLGGYGAPFLKRYAWSANLDRLSYLKGSPEVAKYYRPLTAMRGELGAAFNPRDAEFLKAVPRGGGAAAAVLTVGGDVYDYTLGHDKGKGLLSNDFAAATTVDLGVTAGSIAAGAGASALTGAATGAAFGSVVPGLGTVVGLGVGVGIGALMSTHFGKSVRDGAVHAVSSGLDHVEDGVGDAVHAVGDFFS